MWKKRPPREGHFDVGGSRSSACAARGRPSGHSQTKCRGITQKHKRCKNRPDRNKQNGYCRHHQPTAEPGQDATTPAVETLATLAVGGLLSRTGGAGGSSWTFVDSAAGRTEEEQYIKAEAEGESRVASTPAPAPASNEEAEPSALAAADPPEPAPSLSVPSKRKILVKIQGAGHLDAHDVQSLLRELVRDRTISRPAHWPPEKVKNAVEAQGERPYYLEELHPSAVGNAKGHVTEVDHVIECQLVGHAILQTQEFHKVLKDLNMGGSPRSMHINRTSEQPFVVQNALKPIKQIQNCEGDEYNCFNLRLMSKSLNITKGKAITRWIESRQKWSEGKPLPHNVRVDLQDAFGTCEALKNGEIDRTEADKLAAELQKSLIKAASDFEGFLQKRAGELVKSYQEYKDLATRLQKLGETIGELRNEFENE